MARGAEQRRDMGKGKSKKVKNGDKAKPLLAVPKVIEPTEDAPVLETAHGSFDLEDPILPEWIEERSLKSGGYPYDDTIKNKLYDSDLTELQVELVKLQQHVSEKGERIVLVFEGRDSAGKGGCIAAISQFINPRTARIVALPKPTETERGQWYFQRYVGHLPTTGEMVMFDRSWYNRGVVEPVMGFCTPAEHKRFLGQAPGFEAMLVEDGIRLFKFWLDIGREMQLKRFHERRHNPLKIWKLSPVDYAAMTKWSDYTGARDEMLRETDTKKAPWTVVLANDQKRARLNVIRHMLSAIDYAGRDDNVVKSPDPLIVGSARKLLGKD
jgi:polyphosphate kinase 2